MEAEVLPQGEVSSFWGWRGSRRPDPKFSLAFAGLGGFAISVGIQIFASDQFGQDRKWLAVLISFAALAASFIGMKMLPDPFRAAAMGGSIIPVFMSWGYTFFLQDDADLDDLKIVLLLSIATYLFLYIAPQIRGRGAFLAAALVFIWIFGVIQVGDNAFGPLSSRTRTTFSNPSSSLYGPAAQSMRLGSAPQAESDFCTTEFFSESYVEQYCNEDGTFKDDLFTTDQNGGTGSDSSDDSSPYTYDDPQDSSDFNSDDFGSDSTDPYDYSDDSSDFSDNSDDIYRSSFDDDSSMDPFTEVIGAGRDFGNNVSWMTLILGSLYVGLGAIFDRKARAGLATPFVGTGIVLFPLGATLTSFDFGARSSGDVTSAARLGVQWLIAGAILCAVGASSPITRRFSTWLGGIVATIGLSTWIIDLIRPDSSNQESLTSLLIGAVLVAIGFAGGMLLKEGNDGPSSDGVDLVPAGLGGGTGTLVTESPSPITDNAPTEAPTEAMTVASGDAEVPTMVDPTAEDAAWDALQTTELAPTTPTELGGLNPNGDSTEEK